MFVMYSASQVMAFEVWPVYLSFTVVFTNITDANKPSAASEKLKKLWLNIRNYILFSS